ncbi:lipopolysaccharide transport periplasmic protein LptA [Gilvimarinus algae]|uniref:Lipopolysaccharide export system protein LptA n=1 Tax=Gilvimarinus algae TaxID=3058037 RepID=A0ABT8TGV9_9GAMM|nr:lipopolysaccharide transport periplasmic protein LptA [Gilvimarinus sp. SDUM040014]MDO3382855.1 lipopolysaccharide transport periplasmic protein LptA [Gilvimarinus sp. SDUM040014]
MNPSKWRRAPRRLFALLLVLAAAGASALPEDRQQSFQLQADQQTFDQKNGRVTYTGSARLQQGSLIINADQIVVEFAADNSVKQITATGSPAHFQQQPSLERGIVTAQAQEIVYNSEKNTVSMSVKARLEQDGAVMEGHSIHYDLTRELVSAEGDGESSEPIRMVIPPAVIEQ